MSKSIRLKRQVYRSTKAVLAAKEISYLPLSGIDYPTSLEDLVSLHKQSSNRAMQQWIEHNREYFELLRHAFLWLKGKGVERVEERLTLTGKLISDVPSSIGILKRLERVNFAGNQLTTLPTEFGNLENLKRLSLAVNHFRDLPDSVVRLQNLEFLNLTNNGLKSFPSIDSKKLRCLKIGENQLNVFPDVVELKALEYLDLHQNALKTLPPPQVASLQTLKYLDLSYNDLQTIPEEIGSLKNLEHLDFSFNNLRTLPNFGNLKESLTFLNLRVNSSLTTLPDDIDQLKLLTHLDLRETGLKEELFKHNTVTDNFLYDYERAFEYEGDFDEDCLFVEKNRVSDNVVEEENASRGALRCRVSHHSSKISSKRERMSTLAKSNPPSSPLLPSDKTWNASSPW